MSDIIHQWVADQTGLTTIWQNQNAPRPERPYCAIQITSVNRIGEAAYGQVDTDGDRAVMLDREAVVSVTIYEHRYNNDPRCALNKAEDLRDSLDLSSVRQSLMDGGWAVRGIELLSDAPQLIDIWWEPRAVFDVRFGTIKEMVEEVGLIETIQITGTEKTSGYTTESEG